jgi:hypothetical protein
METMEQRVERLESELAWLAGMVIAFVQQTNLVVATMAETAGPLSPDAEAHLRDRAVQARIMRDVLDRLDVGLRTPVPRAPKGVPLAEHMSKLVAGMRMANQIVDAGGTN